MVDVNRTLQDLCGTWALIVNQSSDIGRFVTLSLDISLEDGQLQIELIGDLATLLGFADKNRRDKKKPGSLGDPGSTKWLVAGARCHLYRTWAKR